MLKENTLKKNREFQELINSKKQYVTHFLILYYKPTDSKLRAGISVSKKFANAVGRNKQRRQTKAALDLINPWDKKFDVVIILRKDYLTLPFDRKVEELKKVFERL